MTLPNFSRRTRHRARIRAKFVESAVRKLLDMNLLVSEN
jgi:hypothetical protein